MFDNFSWNNNSENNSGTVKYSEKSTNIWSQFYAAFWIAIISNTLILISTGWLRRTNLTPNLCLCISLAGSDAWTALLMFFGLVLNSYIRVIYKLGDSPNYQCYVLLLEMFRISAMLISALHLFLLGANQCFSIADPFRYKVHVTTNRCKTVIGFIWAVPSVGIFAYFSSYPDEGFFVPGCSARFYFTFSFRLGIFLMFSIPLFVTFIIYGYVLKCLLKARHDFELMGTLESMVIRIRRLKQKTKTVLTTFIIVGTFTVAWLPLIILFLTICLEGCFLNPKQGHIDPMIQLTVNTVANGLVMIKLILNPLIYTIRITSIRLAFWLMWKSRLGILKVPPHRIPYRYQSVCSSGGSILR